MTSWIDVVQAMETIAPLRLAQGWDNVGLLVEPPEPRPVRRVLLAIDLTAPVWDEAVARDVDFVVAYHPPIFSGWKRLSIAHPQQRIALQAAHRGVPIHAPHTALDAAAGGMGDWLADACGPTSRRAPIEPVEPGSAEGSGRLVQLQEPASLEALLPRIKAHLGLRNLRVAAAHGSGAPIRTVAFCPGAGGSIFEDVVADLLVTGEMRHHDVLARCSRGASVVLTDHTHTERGYLPHLARRVAAALPGVDVVTSDADRDPLEVR